MTRRVTAHRAATAATVVSVLAALALAVPTVLRELDGEQAAHASGVNAFRPDETRVRDCDAGDSRCLGQAFGNLGWHDGAVAALARLDRRVALGDSRGCHRAAHEVGRAVLARSGGDVASALGEGDDVCGSGYYHGVMQAALERAPAATRRSRLSELCTTSDDDHRSRTRSCLHGLGHGVVIMETYDLHAALELCDAADTRWQRRACHGGAFMEAFAPTYADGAATGRSLDPLAPCPALADRYRDACYRAVTARILTQAPGDWSGFGRICDGVEQRWRHSCFTGMGGKAALHHHYDVDASISACAAAGDRGGARRDCTIGTARAFVSADPTLASPRLLCDSLRERQDLQRACHWGAGGEIAMREDARSGRIAACTRLSPSGHGRRSCLEAALGAS